MFPDEGIKSQLLQQKVQDKIESSIVVTEANARASYTQWHVQHILIGNTTRSDVQAQVIAQKVDALALAPGANFSALAEKYSEDPGTKKSGGDDNWIDHTTTYVPEFKNAAFALKKGEITTIPVKSPQYGYFIIKCIDIRSNLPKDFDTNKAKYIAQVQNEERQSSYDERIAELKSDPTTVIKITDPQLLADRTIASISQSVDSTARKDALKTALTEYIAASGDSDLSYQDKGSVDAQISEIYQFRGYKG